jgi:hypothetical protein
MRTRLMAPILLALALALVAPPVQAAQRYYIEVNSYCQEDADTHDLYLIRATVSMWTDRERVKRMVLIFKEHRDYTHTDRWHLARSAREVAWRSVGGVDIYGWFGGGSYYDTRFFPENYDAKVDLIALWKGRDGERFQEIRLPVGEKRLASSQCFSQDFGEPPPRPI